MSSKQTSPGGTFGGFLEGISGGRVQRGLALVCAVAISLVLFAVLANPAKAAELTVTNTDDSGPGSLRDAINTANANGESDTITFDVPDNSTITLTSGELLVADDTASPDLTIDGTTVNNLTVSGNNTSRVFLIDIGAEAEIAGLTVRDGGETVGGGILNFGTLTLTNTTVSSNVAGSGGGGIRNSGTLTVTGSTISGNAADGDGGGIENSGTLTVNNSTISGNTVEFGNGGGIRNGGTLTVNNSTISGNYAIEGGGIYSSTNSVSDTTPNPSQRTTIRNSTVSGNEASGVGGGVYHGYGLTVIENSTITKNTAPENNGGGVGSAGNSNTRTDVRASIISENTTTDVNFLENPFDSNNSFRSLGSNIVGDGNATPAFNEPGDQVGVENPGLGLLQDNGGPTETHAVLAGSSALDAVEPAGTTAAATQEPCGVQQDQRGVSRPQDGDDNGTAKCDIGSFEARKATAQITPPAEDFGDQQEGTQSAPQTSTVENTGDINLVISSVGIAGTDSAAFGKQNDNCEGNTVASGESCAVEVVFSPNSAGDKSALLQIQSNASSSPDTAQLSGTGTAVPPAPTPTPPAPAPPAPAPPVSNPEPPKPPVTNPKPPNTNNPNACTIKGNNRNNILKGTPRRDVICGFGGNDIIRGLGGNDVIRGGRGNDVIFGQRGNDKLYGGSGNDIIYGQAGRDRLYGQRGNDALFGGRGRDVLFGGPGKDFVNDGVKREVKRSVIDAKKAGEQAKKEARKLVNDVLRQVGIRR